MSESLGVQFANSIATDLAPLPTRQNDTLNGLEKNEPQIPPRPQILQCPPNVSLNLQPRASQGYLWFAAVSGILLQSGVLIFAGVITYLPSLSPKFQTNGGPAPSYAYPTFATGTVVLVLGMFMCSLAVDWATRKYSWSFKGREDQQRSDIQILWFQKSRFDSYQVFKSYAIMPQNPCKMLHTSWREESWENDSEHRFWTAREIVAVLGAAAALLGFLGQFEGLRGMNWAVSVAQLGVTFLMLVIRSFMRRDIRKCSSNRPLREDHEMDAIALWLAVDIRWLEDFPKDQNLVYRFDPPQNSDPEVETLQKAAVVGNQHLRDERGEFVVDKTNSGYTWRVLTGPDIRPKRGKFIEKDDLEKETENYSKGEFERAAVNIRARLSQLTAWSSPTTLAAEMLEIALLSVMKELFGTEKGFYFRWRLDIGAIKERMPDSCPYIDLIVGEDELPEAIRRKTMPLKYQIEAILSLWHHCWPDHGDTASTSYEVVRILGRSTRLLRRDLQWWGGQDTEPEVNTFRSILSTKMQVIGVLRGDMDSRVAYRRERGSLPLLMVQHLFTTFMWALADCIPFSVFTTTNTTIDSSNYINSSRPWTSYTLKNSRLSRMVNTLSKIGLGRPEDIYMMVIPPLSHARKLPSEKMVDCVSSSIEKAKEQDTYLEALSAHIELLDYARNFNHHWSDRFLLRSGASAMELMKLLCDRIDAETDSKGESAKSLFEQRKQLGGKIVKTLHTESVAILSKAYQYQRREEYVWLQYAISSWENPFGNALDNNYKLFGFTKTHIVVLDSRDGTPPKHDLRDPCTGLKSDKILGDEGAAPDFFGWTPLQYANGQNCTVGVLQFTRNKGGRISSIQQYQTRVEAAAALQMIIVHGNFEVAKSLLSMHSDILSIQDKAGLLLPAAENGNDAVVTLLLDDIHPDIVNVTDHMGRTPLHLAVKNGHLNVIKVLERHAARNNQKIAHIAAQRDFQGRNALHFAARLQNSAGNVFENLLKWLVEGEKATNNLSATGGILNIADKEGFTPLHIATAANSEGAIEFLLKNEVDLSLRTCIGCGEWTALDLAVNLRCERAVEVLLAHFPEENKPATHRAIQRGDYTPLYLAVEMGASGILRILLDHFSLFLPEDNQRSLSTGNGKYGPNFVPILNGLLAYAAAKSTTNVDEIIDMLTMESTGLESTYLGLTPLKWATLYNKDLAAEAILNRSSSGIVKAIERSDPLVLSDLHYAAANSDPYILNLLLQNRKGLSIYEQGPYGNALQVACLAGHWENAKILLDLDELKDDESLPAVTDQHGWSAFSELQSLSDSDREMNRTLVNARRVPGKVTARIIFSDLPRPSAWDRSFKSDVLKIVDNDPLVVEHIGNTSVVGAIRANHPIPPGTRRFSFEITVDEGSGTSSRISVGLVSGFMSMNSLPGFTDRRIDSLVQCRKVREPLNQLSTQPQEHNQRSESWGFPTTVKPGDKISCTYNCDFDNAWISWGKNGEEDLDRMPIKGWKKLFPVIGMETCGTRIKTNFEAPTAQSELDLASLTDFYSTKPRLGARHHLGPEGGRCETPSAWRDGPEYVNSEGDAVWIEQFDNLRPDSVAAEVLDAECVGHDSSSDIVVDENGAETGDTLDVRAESRRGSSNGTSRSAASLAEKSQSSSTASCPLARLPYDIVTHELIPQFAVPAVLFESSNPIAQARPSSLPLRKLASTSKYFRSLVSGQYKTYLQHQYPGVYSDIIYQASIAGVNLDTINWSSRVLQAEKLCYRWERRQFFTSPVTVDAGQAQPADTQRSSNNRRNNRNNSRPAEYSPCIDVSASLNGTETLVIGQGTQLAVRVGEYKPWKVVTRKHMASGTDDLLGVHIYDEDTIIASRSIGFELVRNVKGKDGENLKVSEITNLFQTRLPTDGVSSSCLDPTLSSARPFAITSTVADSHKLQIFSLTNQDAHFSLPKLPSLESSIPSKGWASTFLTSTTVAVGHRTGLSLYTLSQSSLSDPIDIPQPATSYTHDLSVQSLTRLAAPFSPSLLASGWSDGEIRILDTRTNTYVATYNNPVSNGTVPIYSLLHTAPLSNTLLAGSSTHYALEMHDLRYNKSMVAEFSSSIFGSLPVPPETKKQDLVSNGCLMFFPHEDNRPRDRHRHTSSAIYCLASSGLGSGKLYMGQESAVLQVDLRERKKGKHWGQGLTAAEKVKKREGERNQGRSVQMFWFDPGKQQTDGVDEDETHHFHAGQQWYCGKGTEAFGVRQRGAMRGAARGAGMFD
ncbi:hypothetical protein ABW20_dc0102394 [Dactylellina cionopaga]|nr:hypothetical protein ABW20_dc0102394 [Dactylellina cionopaga]